MPDHSFHFAPQIPRLWPAEIGMLCGAVCSLLVFLFCWAALFAYIIRKRDWPPKACNLAGLPFIVIGGVFLLRDFFWNTDFPKLHNPTYIAIFALYAVPACRELAYPEIGPSDPLAGGQPPSLFPR